MRIIGGRDYYDSAMGYGMDTEVIFVRKVRKIPRNELRFHRCRISDWEEKGRAMSGNWVTLVPINVYFCGHLYVGLRVDLRRSSESLCWSLDDALKTLARGEVENDYLKKVIAEYFASAPRSDCEREKLVEKGITVAMAHSNENQYFPERNNWQVDGDFLRRLEFYRVKDAFTAFQEIYAWVSGVLPAPSNKMVKIVDEKIRISKRGFDPVTSFRKEPTKKKKPS